MDSRMEMVLVGEMGNGMEVVGWQELAMEWRWLTWMDGQWAEVVDQVGQAMGWRRL